LPQPGIPLPPIKFHLRQFRHERKINNAPTKHTLEKRACVDDKLHYLATTSKAG
jgi:hypothetical protein